MTPERSAETMVRARPHGYVKEFRDFRHKTQFDKPYTNRPFRFLHRHQQSVTPAVGQQALHTVAGTRSSPDSSRRCSPLSLVTHPFAPLTLSALRSRPSILHVSAAEALTASQIHRTIAA
nr:hypothetical protein Iba_chr13bCG13950 [Ipomoea batatas]